MVTWGRLHPKGQSPEGTIICQTTPLTTQCPPNVIPATGVLAKPLAVWWGGKAGIHGASSRTQRKPARNSVLTTEDTLLYGFLPSRLCENTFISPEGVDYSPGRSPGFFGLRNRRNILAPAHTFERSRSKVWAGAFYEDVCLCRVPRTASWAIFSVLHFVPDFLATAGHSAPFHTVSFAGMTKKSRVEASS